MILEYLKTSWDTYKENITSFILASIILWIIPILIVLTGTWIVLGSTGISVFTKIYNKEIILSRIFYFIPLLINIGFLSIFFIIAGLTYIFLLVGMFGVIAQSLRGETKFLAIFKFVKSKGLTGLLTFVIVGILQIFMFLILVVGLGIISSPIRIIGLILFGLETILFSLVFPGIILDNLNTIESITTSVGIVKRNYIEMLSLLLVYFALFILLSFIPVVGYLIIAFLIFPMLCISLAIFYKKRK